MVIWQDNTALNLAIGQSPVLFLDVDGTLQPSEERELRLGEFSDEPMNTCRSIHYLVTGTHAKIVLCSDRVIQGVDRLIDGLDRAGLARHLILGQCDPEVYPENGESTKTQRVLEWLEFAAEHGVHPKHFAILDDARSFIEHPLLGHHHVAPVGEVASTAEFIRVWDILDPDSRHFRPRAFRHPNRR